MADGAIRRRRPGHRGGGSLTRRLVGPRRSDVLGRGPGDLDLVGQGMARRRLSQPRSWPSPASTSSSRTRFWPDASPNGRPHLIPTLPEILRGEAVALSTPMPRRARPTWPAGSACPASSPSWRRRRPSGPRRPIWGKRPARALRPARRRLRRATRWTASRPPRPARTPTSLERPGRRQRRPRRALIALHEAAESRQGRRPRPRNHRPLRRYAHRRQLRLGS